MFTFRQGGAVRALAVSPVAFQAPAPAAAFDGFSPVSMQTLDHVRGGFSMEMNYGQLMLAMNTTQVSVINGIVVPGQQIIGSSGGSSTLIQQGLNNSVNPVVLNNIPSGSMSTVIQNGLNDQVIGSISTLNITITSQMLAQAVNMQSLTQSALLRFLH
jgi:hypothetical protein